ncbi:tigger transposable element-derived protein 3-like [Ahaetulla prasina]|uniref:tigger transposable element-derived protein 3-like n=1 Tax=Ahaetulla prasina TaxID=499056 RepID=UPI0026486A50|nr:tigger transposable element-derived protein 3-like [Ahaetulla prasina]XP_058037494.1 tigger transposable element-derived protein 3-like [Ahaetulla prasina]XP_058037495.1 tigger transposable element-derived protein 3-like [Ahaetulla prasina]XP_058037496.1 tigger transposable element-derived protein 3-like [Ahaetulla prasina]XP_058037497.1 tigger transposable element-derived protein 3-like [Ahaetulla prasina]XP_058037498.1 tigger transposable element-derived protein 3-like [Ahaetulla prasina]
MMKEMERDPENCGYQGVEESWQPKIIKQEEEEDDGLEMHLNQLEAAAVVQCATNGLHQVAQKPSSPEPILLGSGATNEEILLVDYQVSPLVRGCRPQLGELPHWCLECGKSFSLKSELEIHQSKHAGQNSFICGDCGRSFMEHMALSGQGACAAGHPFSPSVSRRKGPSLPGEAGVQRKERKELSLQEKVRVLEMLEGPKVSQSELAKRFGVSQPQICRIIKNKERILAEWGKNANPGRKRKLEDKGPAGGDRAFLQWFERSCGHPFSAEGKLWQEKVTFGGGEPGLETTLQWPNSSLAKPKTGPRRSLPEKWSRELLEEEDDEDDNRWESTTLPCILSHYDLPNVYACGETGMLFRATPEDLVARRGGEAQDQLTILLCANMDGSDKKDVLIVGKAARPFGDLQGLSSATYKMNSRAWMTPTIFSEWLQKFNEEMKQQERRVALFVTQCGVHPYAELSNVQMVFMPPHLAWLPPLEQGVIQNFKCHYRRRMLTHLLVKDHGKVSSPTSKLSRFLTLLDAVHLLVQAWSEVCPQTIANSFKAAGFSANPRLLTPPLEVVQALGCKDQDQFEQYVLMDEGLECFGDQESIDPTKEVPQPQEPISVRAEEEEKEEPALFSCPSKAEVVDSLAKLRRYLECHSVSPNTFQTFYQLEDLIHALALSDMQLVRAKPCQD